MPHRIMELLNFQFLDAFLYVQLCKLPVAAVALCHTATGTQRGPTESTYKSVELECSGITVTELWLLWASIDW